MNNLVRIFKIINGKGDFSPSFYNMKFLIYRYNEDYYLSPYKWEYFISSLKNAVSKKGNEGFYLGDESPLGWKYGLINVAAFMANFIVSYVMNGEKCHNAPNSPQCSKAWLKNHFALEIMKWTNRVQNNSLGYDWIESIKDFVDSGLIRPPFPPQQSIIYDSSKLYLGLGKDDDISDDTLRYEHFINILNMFGLYFKDHFEYPRYLCDNNYKCKSSKDPQSVSNKTCQVTCVPNEPTYKCNTIDYSCKESLDVNANDYDTCSELCSRLKQGLLPVFEEEEEGEEIINDDEELDPKISSTTLIISSIIFILIIIAIIFWIIRLIRNN